jgi:Cu+-exporting ATPase
MDVLIALGTSAAYFYSVYSLVRSVITQEASMGQYFETSVFLIFFVLLGKYLECYAKGKTGEAVAKLLALAPETAILVTVDGKAESGNVGNIIKEEEISIGLVQGKDINSLNLHFMRTYAKNDTIFVT